MVAITGPSTTLTASDLMCPGVVTISQDTPLPAAAEVFFQLRIEEAAVVDAEGRCVGKLSATDLLRWSLQEAGGAEVLPPACPHQVKGRLLSCEDAMICTQARGNCPMQELRAMTGGRHTTLCALRGGPVSDRHQPSGDGHTGGVRRYMTAGSTVEAESPLPELARTVIDARAHRLIVVDQQYRPVGTVSCLHVLAALAGRGSSAAGGRADVK